MAWWLLRAVRRPGISGRRRRAVSLAVEITIKSDSLLFGRLVTRRRPGHEVRGRFEERLQERACCVSARVYAAAAGQALNQRSPNITALRCLAPSIPSARVYRRAEHDMRLFHVPMRRIEVKVRGRWCTRSMGKSMEYGDDNIEARCRDEVARCTFEWTSRATPEITYSGWWHPSPCHPPYQPSEVQRVLPFRDGWGPGWACLDHQIRRR